MGARAEFAAVLSGDPSQVAEIGLERVALALATAGGPSPAGSLRHIKVMRGGKAVGIFDAYDLLLSGDRKGQWAMTINGPWRLCFRFENGDAYDVEFCDYH